MSIAKRRVLPGLLGLFLFTLFCAAAEQASAEVWRSPLHSRPYIEIEKRLRNPLLDAELTENLPAAEIYLPLPATLASLLGPDTVDYDSFVASYPPPAQLDAVIAQAKANGLIYMAGLDRTIQLPYYGFLAGDPDRRTDSGFPSGVRATAVPGLYLVQFAYPVRDEWLSSLAACGLTNSASFSARTLLLQAPSPGAILGCPCSRYVSWIDAYLTTDRLAPEFLNGEYSLGYTLQYRRGTNLATKAVGLPAGVVVDDLLESDTDGLALLKVRASMADLRAIGTGDPDLLSIGRRSQGAVSDERQGQIAAGNYNSNGTVTAPGYRSWLTSRGLMTPANQQVVAVLDIGYDGGNPPNTPSLTHHPDLESPERLVVLNRAPPTLADAADQFGHGTMVSGIIVGDGTAGSGTGGHDLQGFLYGSGIAPGAKLAFSKILHNLIDDPATLGGALNSVRNNAADGSDLALLVNHSANRFVTTNGQDVPNAAYDDLASFWDARVIDANSTQAGAQPMTVVVSAGNYAYDPTTGTVRSDSVCSGATAKNVIAVGATTSYRPVAESGEPPLDCGAMSNNSRPPNQDALHVSRLGLFSGRGKSFGPLPSASLVTNTRIKPDLVAPGVRVFSTVPYSYSGYPGPDGYVGCQLYSPLPNVNYYTYGTGTSFAAPVVTGVAALARKWFLDRGTPPSPSLVKASLIATADDIGGVLSNDHRPSPGSGWGRVSLGRLTDSASRFYVTDNLGLAVGTGQLRSWTRTIGSPSSDTYIVLVWSDPPSVMGNSQVALVNDLMLTVQRSDGSVVWRGNNFNENITGTDNGYSYPYPAGSSPVNDTINNVEAVFIPAGTFTSGQQLLISVTGVNVAQGPQKFALYAYNIQLAQ